MDSRFSLLAARIVERIRINTTRRVVRDGRLYWVKQRRRIAAPVLSAANLFFRFAGAPIHTIPDIAAWQRWEVDCFSALHGDRFRAFAEAPRLVGTEELPGVNLTDHLDGQTLTPAMAGAAARELRRAHAWHCSAINALWSHGDPHVGNFIYHQASDTARIIDFEVIHHRGMPPDDRHADDLLVFLQDMVGRISAELWLPCAHAFLAAYERPEIVARLALAFVVPSQLSFARLWWKVRTGFLPDAELTRRIAALRLTQ